VEVEPILEVLVGKVLEQGLMEVLQEEELAAMRRHQVGGARHRSVAASGIQNVSLRVYCKRVHALTPTCP
jgi:hypothetical protein